MTYTVNEVFYSLQGEGMRTGTANFFVRLTGCNQTCLVETHGFDCDTEFASGRKLSAQQILEECITLSPLCKNVIFTGGEPLLQLDANLTHTFKDAGFYIACETNGSKALPPNTVVDWVTCSPKVAEHAIRLTHADEIKYVRGYGQAIPRPSLHAVNRLISPAFDGLITDARTIKWCVDLVRDNPDWRLSLQTHKVLNVR